MAALKSQQQVSFSGGGSGGTSRQIKCAVDPSLPGLLQRLCLKQLILLDLNVI
jgi:hypothetical protein